MDEQTMRKLYEFNKAIPQIPLAPIQRKRKAESQADSESNLKSAWAGYHVRMMLHCLYVISMLCLLRYDEALGIRWEDIEFGTNAEGLTYICLNLLVRKTHQNGSTWCFTSSFLLKSLP